MPDSVDRTSGRIGVVGLVAVAIIGTAGTFWLVHTGVQGAELAVAAGIAGVAVGALSNLATNRTGTGGDVQPTETGVALANAMTQLQASVPAYTVEDFAARLAHLSARAPGPIGQDLVGGLSQGVAQGSAAWGTPLPDGAEVRGAAAHYQGTPVVGDEHYPPDAVDVAVELDDGQPWTPDATLAAFNDGVMPETQRPDQPPAS